MDIHTDLSILALIAQSSFVVKIVIAILLLMSFWSLTKIALKYLQLRRATKESILFEDDFWRGGDLGAIYQSMGNARIGDGMKHIFVSGFREYTKHRKQGSSAAVAIDSTRRAMRVAYQRELDRLEANLPGLATIGSVSPYIGLFGTVWGIMNSFRGLASVAQATLAQVAPGIAEALIATAIGLFAAIPAAIAYNRFTNDVDRLATRYETFIEEFANILQRQS